VTLSPVVDPACSKALNSSAREIAGAKLFVTPDHAVSVCKRTASG
jgi:hypothetical protein